MGDEVDLLATRIRQHIEAVERAYVEAQERADAAMQRRFEGFGGTDLQPPLTPDALLEWHHYHTQAMACKTHLDFAREFLKGKPPGPGPTALA